MRTLNPTHSHPLERQMRTPHSLLGSLWRTFPFSVCSWFRRIGRRRPEAEKADEHRDNDQGRAGSALQPPVQTVRCRHRPDCRVAGARARGRTSLVLQPASEGEADDGAGRRPDGRPAAAARRRSRRPPVLSHCRRCCRERDVSSRIFHVHVCRAGWLHIDRNRQPVRKFNIQLPGVLASGVLASEDERHGNPPQNYKL